MSSLTFGSSKYGHARVLVSLYFIGWGLHTHDEWVLIYYVFLYLSRLPSLKASPEPLVLGREVASRVVYCIVTLSLPNLELIVEER